VLAGSLDEDAQREREMARTLIDRRVDGLIVMPAGLDHRYVLIEQQAGTAFVFIDRASSPLLADAVVSDNRGAAREAVRHLVKTGRRSVAYFGDDLIIPTAQDRFDGFCDAVAEAGIDQNGELVRHGLRTAEQARLVARELLTGAAPPQAVFTSQNLVTIGVVQALHELDLQHVIALVGFDDVPLAGAVRPGLTVMAQDPTALGMLAAERLFARLAGEASPPRIYTVPTRLLVRGSGELPLPS
jgi:LacI family transcriptional regulator